jgi:two-component system, NtrC family, response regulator AtoC
MTSAKLLIVDDEKRMCSILKAALEDSQRLITTADSGEAAVAALGIESFDIVLSDIKMPGISGLQLLEKVKARNPDTEVLLMTAYADTQTAVEAMKKGAYDYLIKPFEMDELRLKIAQILEKRSLKQENVQLKSRIKKTFSLENMIGRSGAMQQVYELVQKVAASDATVLIRGESGTGKELIAQAVHQLSKRHDQPFIAVNCAALPETLLESELFGHEKGAFTGADRQKPGRFELAATGSLFLDEIGDMSPATQVKMLRVLQAKEIMRVGGTETIPIQARTIAATNRNLEEAVKKAAFREDLYYRINVFPIQLPPLRERKEDIPDLVSHFLKQQNLDAHAIDPNVMPLLTAYNWPGNVRELENLIERAVIMSGGQIITPADLPPHVHGEVTAGSLSSSGEDFPTLDDMEKTMIQKALLRAHGNKTVAAQLLGITRRQLYSKMERWTGPVR